MANNKRFRACSFFSYSPSSVVRLCVRACVRASGGRLIKLGGPLRSSPLRTSGDGNERWGTAIGTVARAPTPRSVANLAGVPSLVGTVPAAVVSRSLACSTVITGRRAPPGTPADGRACRRVRVRATAGGCVFQEIKSRRWRRQYSRR